MLRINSLNYEKKVVTFGEKSRHVMMKTDWCDVHVISLHSVTQ